VKIINEESRYNYIKKASTGVRHLTARYMKYRLKSTITRKRDKASITVIVYEGKLQK